MFKNGFFNKQFSSFTYLNITQFLGALNDNTYKLFIVYFLIDIFGFEKSPLVLSSTGAVFVLPFLLFSASSGTLADRFSKRNIIVLTKVFELMIMAIGVLSFAFESTIGAYFTLFLMATQSAIFSPSKYGIIPEIVSNEKISQANGLMTSFTFLAIIIGTFLASFITDITSRDFILGALLCTVIALVGIVTSFGIEYTPPSGSSNRFDVIFFREFIRALKVAHHEPSLLPALFGTAFFLFLGSFLQLNMIPFAVESLGLTDVQGGYIFLIAAIGIGTGAVIAGKISGSAVEIGLVPVSAVGLTIGCYLVDYFSDNLYAILPLIGILGALGGLYQVPLDSFIQVSSPSDKRGQIIAAANFLSFLGVLAASGFVFLTITILGISPAKAFTLMGTISLVVSCFFIVQFFDYTSRFVGMVLSRLHFSTTHRGLENIPSSPVIYVCHHTAWNDTLLILGAQKRRVRFFIEKEQHHGKWMKKLYKLLRVVMIPSIESLEDEPNYIKTIHRTIEKGISVCIFVDAAHVNEEIETLKNSEDFQKLFKNTECPIFPVYIEKGTKTETSKYFEKIFEKFRVPAQVTFEPAK
ncbi:MAG: hypothetical protein Tsb0021_02950 [Chlamydiales bacterium]